VDRVPFTAWRHHYWQSQTADGLARATLEFYRQVDPDMVVLAPGPFYLAEAWGADIRSFGSDDLAPYVVSPVVPRVTAWRSLPELDVASSSLQRELDAVRQVRARLDDAVPMVVLLYSPLVTADVLCNGRIVEDVRTFSNDLRAGLRAIAVTTCAFARACLEGGADGYLYATRLANAPALRPRAYRDFGLRYDLEVLTELARSEIRIIMLEGERPYLDLVIRYPVQAVCWDTWRSDPSLASASRQVRGTLMGGINPSTFAGGSVADVRSQIADAVAQTGGWRLVLAPTGPVPPDARMELLSSIRDIVNEL